MAPQQYRGQFRIQSVPAREDAAQPIDCHRATSRLAPANKEFSALTVEISEGQTAYTPLGVAPIEDMRMRLSQSRSPLILGLFIPLWSRVCLEIL